MKYSNQALLVLAASLALGSANAATIQSDSALIPIGSGYGVGDSFQLVFVTSTRTNMSSIEADLAYAGTLDNGTRTMATFNAYVNNAADGSSNTGISDLTWSVIASTVAIDAKDNAVVTGPVHRVGDGVKVVDDAADMWDGSIDALINTNESGGSVAGGNWQVWSGTKTDGTERAGLDQSNTSYASNDNNWNDPAFLNQGQANADEHWIDLTSIDTGDNRVYRFYALSETITIVPEPGSLALLGLGGLLVATRRRRG